MQILEFMQIYIHDKWTFLIILKIFLLLVGYMIDIFSAIVVVVPLFVLIAKSLDVKIVHLGIIFLTNLEIGYSTSPVGVIYCQFSFQRTCDASLFRNMALYCSTNNNLIINYLYSST